jgi:WD40 repeat protein
MRDAYRVEPNPNHASPTTRDWTSSYACAFSHSAKDAWNRAEGRYAAIGTESGGVRVCDTDKSAVSLDTCWDASHEWAGAGAGSSIRQKPSTNEGEETDEPYQLKEGLYAPHTNAIFDVKWSEDDRRIATASADQSSVVWDTSRIEAGYEGSEKADGMIARLMGHNASVKSCVWYDPSKSRSDCPGLQTLRYPSICRYVSKLGKRWAYPYI